MVLADEIVESVVAALSYKGVDTSGNEVEKFMKNASNSVDGNWMDEIMESVFAALSYKGFDTSGNEVEKLMKNASNTVPGNWIHDAEKIKNFAEDASTQVGYSPNLEISRRNLARWFEIPEEEFKDTPKEQLESDVLIRHIMLEILFQTWLQEWGYEVEVGEDLEGVENIEFIPDIYAHQINLHGSFEIVACFVCDNPPNTYRVRALFEAFESFAREGSEFGERDIFLIVTPFSFGRGITQSITLQNFEEKYNVVALEGNDIAILQAMTNANDRMLELKEHVEKAKNKVNAEHNLINQKRR